MLPPLNSEKYSEWLLDKATAFFFGKLDVDCQEEEGCDVWMERTSSGTWLVRCVDAEQKRFRYLQENWTWDKLPLFAFATRDEALKGLTSATMVIKLPTELEVSSGV